MERGCLLLRQRISKRPNKLGIARQFLDSASRFGYVAEIIESAGIGLANLSSNVSFDDRLVNIKAEAKVEIQSHSQFYIDSYVTGYQLLMCVGVCVLGRSCGKGFLQDWQENAPRDIHNE